MALKEYPIFFINKFVYIVNSLHIVQAFNAAVSPHSSFTLPLAAESHHHGYNVHLCIIFTPNTLQLGND